MAFRNSVPLSCTKEIADPNGRYLLLLGSIQDTEVTIMTYYAPNSNLGPLLAHGCTLFTNHQKGTFHLAGDSNVALNPILDRYPSERVAASPDAKHFSHSFIPCSLSIWWTSGGNFIHWVKITLIIPTPITLTRESTTCLCYVNIFPWYAPHPLLLPLGRTMTLF